MKYDSGTKARTSIVINHPFFASILLGMPLLEDDNISTACTDGRSIRYNPQFFETLTHKVRIGVLIHEVLHVVMLHSFRGGLRDHKMWNEACDFAINLLIRDGGFELPDGCLYDTKFRDKSAEQIYRHLSNHPEDRPADGEGDPLEGDVREASGDPSEKAAAEAKTKVMIASAVAAGKMSGKLPACMTQSIQKAMKHSGNWREHLRQFMTEPLKEDQSWARGQRRFLYTGLFLPALHSLGLGKIAVILDSSGSVYGDAARFLSEIRSVTEDAKPKCVTLLQVDSKVQDAKDYEAGEPLLNSVKGGGGTDLRTGFDYIEKHGVNPVMCIVLTDMYTPFPEVPPPYPVLWVSTTEGIEAPFGETIYMEVD